LPNKRKHLSRFFDAAANLVRLGGQPRTFEDAVASWCPTHHDPMDLFGQVPHVDCLRPEPLRGVFKGAVYRSEALKLGPVWLEANLLKQSQEQLEGSIRTENLAWVSDDRHIILDSADLYAELSLNALRAGSIVLTNESSMRALPCPPPTELKQRNFQPLGSLMSRMKISFFWKTRAEPEGETDAAIP